MKVQNNRRNAQTDVSLTNNQGNDIFQEKDLRASNILQTQSTLKQEYYKRDLDQVKQENKDLRKSLQINKQIMQQLLEGQNKTMQLLIKNNLWELENQVQSLRRERDKLQAELLLKDQIMQESKSQEVQNNMMLEEQIDDLKDKLDRKEYMIQYKEEIWSTFESELKKVIKKDSELYEKIQSTTQILVENLNDKKISNVVKENTLLNRDKCKSIQKIDDLIRKFSNLVIEEVWGHQKYFKQNPQNTNSSEERERNPQLIHDQLLSRKIERLSNVVEQIKNRIEILEEENTFLRQEYTRVSKANIQVNKQIIFLQERVKLYQDSVVTGSGSIFKSTKASTSASTSQNNLNFQNFSDGKDQDIKLRNSLVPPQCQTMNSEENQFKGAQFSLHLQPITPNKQIVLKSSQNQNNIRQNHISKVSEFEINLNRFLHNSPQDFIKNKKLNKVPQIEQQHDIDDDNKENDISMINPCNDNSKGSPFFDTEESYIH